MKILIVLTSHNQLGATGEKTGFWLEDELVARGGSYQKADDWTPLAVVDGLLITGQNPASSAPVADALLEALAQA